ncbi:cupin domain-containing protein [Teredinibacter sp. KSP-S5-2]|uniref:cupin domain-containing protein n=1 Tax=Teredinibacter sp. KSP-S5-2 TaxID=3034506 RepID=UPI0029344C8B|nr:cupin domain-containing protein [Teredinibacter sp. KSP-S5-2]WNO09749.1 cupin domain-containing protein [Teredinibacter sp. KSP-S5-2]
MTKNDYIQRLNLELHPLEGGYFKRTYESSRSVGNGERKLLTSIYYMLTEDSPIGYLHRNKSDILHFYHAGSPIKYLIVSPSGELDEKILGPDVSLGQEPQLLVKGGFWKASELCEGEFGLISEAVSPGFEYADNELAISKALGEISSKLEKYIKI